MELDFSFGVKGLARFRGNNFNQRGAVARSTGRFPTRSWASASWACLPSSRFCAKSREV